MSERFVLDASVALAWFLDESSANKRYASDILDRINAGAEVLVPEHWHYEVGSVLVRVYRDRALSRSRLGAAVALLDAMTIRTVTMGIRASTVIALAQRYHLQGYDALYFHLAVTRALPIATIEGGLRTACAAHAVELVSLSPPAIQ